MGNQMSAPTEVANTRQSAEFYTVSGAVGIWLLFIVAQWVLSLMNYIIHPISPEQLNRFWFAVAGALTIAVALKRKPRILRLSTFGIRIADALFITIVVYVEVNLTFLTLPHHFILGFDPPLEMVLIIGVLPIIEELLCRGIILSSLRQTISPVWAIAISSGLFAVVHVDFWPAFIGEVFISSVYFLRRRSLVVSCLYHVLGNTIVWFPKLIIVAHLRHFV